MWFFVKKYSTLTMRCDQTAWPTINHKEGIIRKTAHIFHLASWDLKSVHSLGHSSLLKIMVPLGLVCKLSDMSTYPLACPWIELVTRLGQQQQQAVFKRLPDALHSLNVNVSGGQHGGGGGGYMDEQFYASSQTVLNDLDSRWGH